MKITCRQSARLTLLIPMIVGLLALPIATYGQALKVGYVDAVTILDKAPQAEEALKQLENEFGPRDQELRNMRDDIQQLEDKLKKDSLVMSDADRRDSEREVRDLKREFQRSNQEFREDYNLRRNEELAKIQRRVTEIILEIAKSENYDLILQDSVYVSEKLDITQRVLDRLSEK
ncbi:MAG: OmpH family outer membrane protein [Gammaproteobacteria bacterium]|nr:OmpH family outer membrane protein [Gammaproteobacteria bacterium]